MNEKDLHSAACEIAANLPGALRCDYKGGWGAFKACNKWFMIFIYAHGMPVIDLRAYELDIPLLQSQFDDIKPAYHMNKNHWISVYPGKTVDKDFLEQLIATSYINLLESLPQDKLSFEQKEYLSHR